MPFNCKYAILTTRHADGVHVLLALAGIEYMIAHSLPIPGEMTLREMFSHSSRAFSEDIARFEPGASFESVVAEMEERMGRHYRYDVVEKQGVGDFLADLRAGGARLCVATAAPRALCSVALERLGLRPHIEFVTDSYEVGLGKSDPAYFPAVARRLGCAPEECWVFEDALHAMESAKAAGMRVAPSPIIPTSRSARPFFPSPTPS